MAQQWRAKRRCIRRREHRRHNVHGGGAYLQAGFFSVTLMPPAWTAARNNAASRRYHRSGDSMYGRCEIMATAAGVTRRALRAFSAKKKSIAKRQYSDAAMVGNGWNRRCGGRWQAPPPAPP